MSFFSNFTNYFSLSPTNITFGGWNSYDFSGMLNSWQPQNIYKPVMDDFSFNSYGKFYNGDSVFASQFGVQNYINNFQKFNCTNNMNSWTYQPVFSVPSNVSMPVSLNLRTVASKTSNNDSSSSNLSELKGKHWSEMTDSQLQQVYGNYTRDITKPYSGTAEDLNRYLIGKGVLEGKGQVFMEAQERYEISAAVLVGIAMNESAKGTSNLARNKNNIGGVRISGSTEFRTFESVDDCIMEMARFLKAGYVDNSGRPLTQLYQINAKYCPTSDPTDTSGHNGFWARAVDKYANEVDAALA